MFIIYVLWMKVDLSVGFFFRLFVNRKKIEIYLNIQHQDFIRSNNNSVNLKNKIAKIIAFYT